MQDKDFWKKNYNKNSLLTLSIQKLVFSCIIQNISNIWKVAAAKPMRVVFANRQTGDPMKRSDCAQNAI